MSNLNIYLISLVKNRSSQNFGFFSRMFGNYLLLKPKEADLQSDLSGIFNKIYESNKPQPHRYKLERVRTAIKK